MELVLDQVTTFTKKVKIISTIGINKKVIDINADVTNWKKLKEVLDINSIPYKDMDVIIGETKTSLQLDEALIPSIDFILFIVPQKVKSGVYSQAQLAAVEKTFASKKGAAVCAAKLGIALEDYINMKNIIKNKVVVVEPIVELPKGIQERLIALYRNLLLEFDEEDDNLVELQSIISDYYILDQPDLSEDDRLDKEDTDKLLEEAKEIQAFLNK